MSFLFGQSGQNPEAFRSSGWEDQGQALNQLFMGNLYGANPQMQAGLQSRMDAINTQINALQNAPSSQQPGWYNPRFAGSQDQYAMVNYRANQDQLANLQNELAGLQSQQAMIDAYSNNPAYAPLPELYFQQRDPYTYTANFDAEKALGDAFTPEYERLQRLTAERGDLERKAIEEDMNRRGLYTAGAASEALGMQRKQEEDRLANAIAGLSADEARQKLGAYQYASNLDFQRQQAQAEELFRQQGATDQQATQLAQWAMQKRGFENQMRRQPQEDLFRLYQLSAGPTPGYEAQPGLLQSVAGPAARAATSWALGAFCLPLGSRIDLDNGEFKAVEDVKIGDEVKGGNVIAVQSRKRPIGHKFYRHNFALGSVKMSLGHPFFDDLISIEPSNLDSENTYDIKTDSGFYFVNGIKLGSTIR